MSQVAGLIEGLKIWVESEGSSELCQLVAVAVEASEGAGVEPENLVRRLNETSAYLVIKDGVPLWIGAADMVTRSEGERERREGTR